jgi:hypothetical protein
MSPLLTLSLFGLNFEEFEDWPLTGISDSYTFVIADFLWERNKSQLMGQTSELRFKVLMIKIYKCLCRVWT